MRSIPVRVPHGDPKSDRAGQVEDQPLPELAYNRLHGCDAIRLIRERGVYLAP